ncbi:MAG: thioredoxin domain-containing protein [Bacteroidetes bacterium]|nr:thioredoxin domain-containing protein [Bacteroidota bacterium]MBS1640131.1 thioredoxin domain-containing protein [Bacteroidota bacterium]MBS1649939.1 thioredoxin domain-containing protein [Bacteroidota bacterium]
MNINIFFYGSLLLYAAGIFISRLLVLYVIDKNNTTTAKWCSVSGKFNCNAVLTSPFSKLSKYIHLADIALAYYTTGLLLTVLSLINGYKNECLAVGFFPSTLLFAFTFFLLLYQSFIIKSWCKLCLLLTAIIWLQQLVEIIYVANIGSINEAIESDKFISFICNALFCVLISSTWLVLKPYILKAKETEQTRKQITKWKTNVHLFNTILKQQRFIETPTWSDDFVIGNAAAKLQLTTAFNPYCPACSYEYKMLKEILKLYPNHIGLTVKFRVITAIKSKHTEAVQYLLHEYFSQATENRINILEQWFDKHDLQVLKEKYGNINEQYKELMQKHEQWFNNAQITHTPTLFVNGYEFPQPFNLRDFKILIPKLIRSEKKQEQPVA